MSTDFIRVINGFKAHAAGMDATLGQPLIATVDSYDGNTHLAKVRYQPQNTVSGWLDIAVPNAGSGTGVFTGLVQGSQVLVIPNLGSAGNGIIVGCIASLAKRPPVPAGTVIQGGETVIVQSTGNSITVRNDGSVNITATTTNITTTGNVNVTAQGTANINAPIVNLGAAGAAFKALCTDAFRLLYNGHTHPNNNQPPSQQAGTNTTTTNTKAS